VKTVNIGPVLIFCRFFFCVYIYVFQACYFQDTAIYGSGIFLERIGKFVKGFLGKSRKLAN